MLNTVPKVANSYDIASFDGFPANSVTPLVQTGPGQTYSAVYALPTTIDASKYSVVKSALQVIVIPGAFTTYPITGNASIEARLDGVWTELQRLNFSWSTGNSIAFSSPVVNPITGLFDALRMQATLTDPNPTAIVWAYQHSEVQRPVGTNFSVAMAYASSGSVITAS